MSARRPGPSRLWSDSIVSSQDDGRWSDQEEAKVGDHIVMFRIGLRHYTCQCGNDVFSLHSIASVQGVTRSGAWLKELKCDCEPESYHDSRVEDGGFPSVEGRGGGWLTMLFGIGDTRDDAWKCLPTTTEPCRVTGYQLRVCGWVGSARIQFASVAESNYPMYPTGTVAVIPGTLDCDHDDRQPLYTPADLDSVVKLDIGGKYVATRMRTLLKPGSLFACLVNGEMEPIVHEGRIFIDMDPDKGVDELSRLRTLPGLGSYDCIMPSEDNRPPNDNLAGNNDTANGNDVPVDMDSAINGAPAGNGHATDVRPSKRNRSL